MKIADLKIHANNLTAESMTDSEILSFANMGIATINGELKTNLPLFVNTSSDYVGLSDSWLMSVLLPYICNGIKLNDSAIAEQSVYQEMFDKNLLALKRSVKTAIDEGFRTDATGGIQFEVNRGANVGWFKRNTSTTTEDSFFSEDDS